VTRPTVTHVAARLFVALVLALGALAYPRFVLSFGGRARMVTSAFFVWPVVHDWFIAAGMLDFALAVPLSVIMLVALNAQRETPSAARGAGIALLAVATWYAHVWPLLTVGLLVVVHVATRRGWAARGEQARRLLPPLVPAGLLVAWSLWVHLTEPAGAMAGFVAFQRYLPPWELFYHLWAEWAWTYTKLEIATVVPCVLLFLWAGYRWRDDVPFFGPCALAVLVAAYAFTPYTTTNWFHVGSRFIPFLWLAALVRLPERLPRRLPAVLGACALVSSVGLGVDYVRLARDWGRYTAGIDAVPEGARLLPFVFRAKGTSENTRALLHVWGLYVEAKHTSAPLLFAHSRSFPVVYREPPPPRLNHLVLEAFAPSMRSPEYMCDTLRAGGIVVDDCEGEWRQRWAEMWREVEPRYDHVLLWEAPPAVMALVPPGYHAVFQRGELTILARGE